MTDKPNWSQVVSELRGFGISLKSIAHKAGASVRHLQDLENGRSRTPVYDVGAALLDLLRKTKA
jgi:hypothetical protein